MIKLMKWHVEEIMENFVVGGFVANDSERFLAGSFILTPMIDTIKVDESNKGRTNEYWKQDSTSSINSKIVNKNVFCKKCVVAVEDDLNLT